MADVFPVVNGNQVSTLMAIAQAAREASFIPDWHMIGGDELGLGSSLTNGLFTNANAAAVVASAELDGRRTLAVGFQESNDAADWTTNFRNINLHYDLYESLMSAINTAVQSGRYDQVLVAGHSLGGAMTQMFMADYAGIAPAYAITTGSPGFLQPAATPDSRIINYQIADDPITVLSSNRIFIGPALKMFPDLSDQLAAAFEFPADMLIDSLPYMTENYYGRGTNEIIPAPGHPTTAPDLLSLLTSLDPDAHDFDTYLANIGLMNADPFDLTGGSRGSAGNDALFGTSGNDLIDGGAGIDTLYLHVNRADLSIVRTQEGLTITSATSGTDKIIGVERLRLADGGLAFDLDGSAGNTAKLIGAVFGSQYLQVEEYVGVGLSLFDSGMTMEQVAQLALDTPLFRGVAGSNSNADYVRYVYQNVVGVAPSDEELAGYVGLLDTGVFTQASLTVLAAETEFNHANIGLIGLAEIGIAFV